MQLVQLKFKNSARNDCSYALLSSLVVLQAHDVDAYTYQRFRRYMELV